jgi:hypothetical protein
VSLNGAHGEEERRGSLLRLASNHQLRLQTLRYEPKFRGDPILDLLARPTPSLTTLVLKYGRRDLLVCPVLGSGSSFERVDLWNTVLPWDSERLRGLRSLYLDINVSSPTPPQIVPILRESPRLEWLRLDLYGTYEDYEIPGVLDREVIRLPKLAYIVLLFPRDYHRCITDLISSDTCDKYVTSYWFDLSLFASDDGVHIQHCLERIVQDLAYLDVEFSVEGEDGNDIGLRLTGNSHTQSESGSLSEYTLDMTLLWSEGRSDRTAWSTVCRFFNRHMRHDVHLRLTLDMITVSDKYVPDYGLLELMETFGSFTSLIFGVGSISHHFIDALESWTASHKSKLSNNPLRFITLNDNFTPDEEDLISLSRFITSLIEFRRTAATVTIADQAARINIMARRSLIQQLKISVGDQVAAEIRWKVRSGFLGGQKTLHGEWREIAGYNDHADDMDSDVVDSPLNQSEETESTDSASF